MADETWETVEKRPKKRTGVRRSKEQQPPKWFVDLPPVPAPNEDDTFEPFILLLMGLPGSGKSTLAKKLEEMMPWKYERVNQDELGNRKACFRRARDILLAKKCPVVDRCNAGLVHRKPFYELAKECGAKVDCIVLEVPRHTCLERCRGRRDHPTIDPRDAGKVIGFMQKEWAIPNLSVETMLRDITTVSQEEEMRELLGSLSL